MYGLTSEVEIIVYLYKLYDRLLEHRYRYYILHNPVLADFEYDWIEKYYNVLAKEYNVKSMDMVDFDFNDEQAIAAGKRVDNGQDNYGLWEAEIRPIWEKLGHPRYRKDE